ncbi:GerAB/ArcD/ProY family transporter [Paenibacillus tengchongensis]|uniref:GerAB/ArcD/ProY family transporter n=1 Tax=Paenibacillus tengchongensis TaxID=2608684 RepID=UPI00124C8DE4|nr:GerAB/ArcD/ProY family transporter [Paenibacillus tengchongensis]
MNEKIRPFNLAVLVYMSQVGIVVFTLPRTLADYFGTNGWLILIPCFLLSGFNIYLISLVYKLGNGRSVFEIMEQSIPKPLLYPFYMGLTAVWMMFGCVIGKKYVLLFQMLAFPTTNPMLFKLMFDILAFMLITKGIYTISRAATMFFWITAWMYLLLLWVLPDFNWVRLTPFILQGGHNQFKGLLEVYGAFLGYEISILLFPYIDRRKKMMAAIQAGNAYLSVSYINLGLVSFGIFSSDQLKQLLYPLLDILAYIQFPFVERLENLLYGFFMFLVLMTVVMYWWGAVETAGRIVPRLKRQVLAFVLLAITYGISFLPKTIDEIDAWISFLGNITTGVAFGLPVLLITVLLIQKKGEKSGG